MKSQFQFDEIILKLNKCEISISQISDKLDKCSAQITTLADSQKLIDYYNRYGFYNQHWLRYFLCEYELKLMNESKNTTHKLNRDLFFNQPYDSDSIEHIYPRNSHNQDWITQFKNYSPDEKRKLKNSLGNFVAIATPKNSKLGNKSFPDKKCNLQNSLGYKYGSYAEIELTNYEDWGAHEILKRGLKLVNFLTTRWNIKIGSNKKNDKKKFLGLEFLK